MDNYTAFEAHETDMYMQIRRRPCCDQCGEPIMEDSAIKIDGELYCEPCFDEWMKKHWVWLEDE